VRAGGTQRGSRRRSRRRHRSEQRASEERTEPHESSRLGLWRRSPCCLRLINSRQQRHSITYKWSISQPTSPTPAIIRRSGEQPAVFVGARGAFERERVRRGPEVRQVLLVVLVDRLVERRADAALQFGVDGLQRPRKLLRVLDPLEVRDDDPAGVREDIGDDLDVPPVSTSSAATVVGPLAASTIAEARRSLTLSAVITPSTAAGISTSTSSVNSSAFEIASGSSQRDPSSTRRSSGVARISPPTYSSIRPPASTWAASVATSSPSGS